MGRSRQKWGSGMHTWRLYGEVVGERSVVAGTHWQEVACIVRRRSSPCAGDKTDTDRRCVGVELLSGERCSRPALPRLLACAYHAPPDAVRMVIVAMDAEIERLKAGG